MLATPSTLLALLRTVAYSWRQERLARDADQVLEVGRRLHARLGTLSGHLTRLGSALGTTMTRFNETVGSYERSVLTAARRFDDLGRRRDPAAHPAAAGGHRPGTAPGRPAARRSASARAPAGPADGRRRTGSAGDDTRYDDGDLSGRAG